MGADRLTRLFSQARGEDRAVLLPYMTAGLPDPHVSASLFAAMAEAGADGFEVGIPYSDPLMDGPIIQEAGRRALVAGTTLGVGIDIAGDVVATTGRPTIVMTYVNPILRVGPAAFVAQCAAAGVDALIVADLPADEAGPIQTAAADAGLGLALFVAPTIDDDRLEQVASFDPVFLYGIAELGVTGERTGSRGRAVTLAKRVRSVTEVPLVMGVGISTPDQAAEAAAFADGVIVGSALVRRVLEAADLDEAAAALRVAVSELSSAMRR